MLDIFVKYLSHTVTWREVHSCRNLARWGSLIHLPSTCQKRVWRSLAITSARSPFRTALHSPDVVQLLASSSTC